jgi:hypothetical protein
MYFKLYDGMENDIESTQREMLMELNQVTNSMNSSQTLPVNGQILSSLIEQLGTQRDQVLTSKGTAYKELFECQKELMKSVPTLSKFLQTTHQIYASLVR